MILRLTLGIALGLKIAQDSLWSWHTLEIATVAVILAIVDRRLRLGGYTN